MRFISLVKLYSRLMFRLSFGSEINVPRPLRRMTSPRSSSSRIARLTVERLRPYALQNAYSPGIKSPGLSSLSVIIPRIARIS